MGEVDVVFGIHKFFEIGKGHYYEITTIFTFFLSLGIIFYFFNLLNFYPVTRFLVTPLLCLVTPVLGYLKSIQQTQTLVLTKMCFLGCLTTRHHLVFSSL